VRGTRTTAAPAFQLVERANEITHLVCCRDVSWRTAFCGAAEEAAVNVDARHICSMCMEQAEASRPGWASGPDLVCPIDDRLCPTEQEIDARIARETGTEAGPSD
jgi:hypothetical protein